MTTRTYGDTFTLPSIRHAVTGEPVTFRIDDVRDIESAGDMYEMRAAFTPIYPATGNRIPTTHAVKIGRAERAVEAVSGIYAKWSHDRLDIWGYGTSHGLTEKMDAAIRADLDALTFDLPGFTVPELRAALIAEAASVGEGAGRLSYMSRPSWDTYRQHEPARILLSEAMDAETRRLMHVALTEAFALAAAEALRVTL